MEDARVFPDAFQTNEAHDIYLQARSIEVDVKESATIAATLANGGACPLNGKRCLDPTTVKSTISLMFSCGMYDYSGEFLYTIGVPCKSGVSGALLLVVPSVMGIAIWSPRLDRLGNSARGVEVCPALNRANPRFKSKARGAAFGYGYNLRVGTRGSSGIAIATLRSPAGCALFADCAQVNDFQPPASPDHPLLEEFYYFDLEGPTVHFRHSHRAETWFADGHVAGTIPALGSEDSRMPEEHIARLPSELILP
jgi:prepilin-type processing-associated H-X9-DG protein